MAKLRHLTIQGTTRSEPYRSTSGGGGDFSLPPRDNPPQHAQDVKDQLQQAQADAHASVGQEADRLDGIALAFRSEPGFALWVEQLDNLTAGIELLNVRQDGDTEIATVFVPDGALGHFERLLDDYLHYPDIATSAGNRRNRRLVESISRIRLAAVREFWTDCEGVFPLADEMMWWEVWVRTDSSEDSTDTGFASFVALAVVEGITLGQQVIHFPERAVVLARCTAEDWATSLALMSHVAELRKAKEVPTEYVELPPRDQIEFVEDFRRRIQPPPADAPAVCLLDTGVNRDHPLIELALAESDWLTVDPLWTPADLHPEQHGTAMSGLALFGCLTSYMGSSQEVVLTHRLESVKILANEVSTEPENYGAITQQAVSRAEIESPSRKRVICLAVLADDRDLGRPTAWSGAVDQLCSGAFDEDREPRLIVIAAGNLSYEARSEYPTGNRERYAVRDPAQAWNALTVGAHTEKVHIQSADYDGWQPLAQHGTLSPSSTTSIPWTWGGSPLKPDVVLEGGNSAVDPSTNRVDFIDDLALLTTTMHASGRLLTTSGETSAAAAQTARMAAMIHAEYPGFWPETVRGLIVHSARWTPEMEKEFPHTQRERRLRCYGFGVPDLDRALYSAENSATLVIQGALQPFRREGKGDVEPNEMHVHPLPWPRDVLEGLGEHAVTLRVSLSYFVEPSPGRRGWGRRFRYQSHGLRFAVKRPTDGDAEFLRRINRAAWEDSDSRPPSGRETRRWQLGKNLRSRGSIHSDSWTGTGAELANCGMIGVYPITGWWRERPHLECWDRQARYSLIVSIETEPERSLFPIDTQLYSAIQEVLAARPEIEIW